MKPPDVTLAFDPFRVEAKVELFGTFRTSSAEVAAVILASAFGARPMSGSERGRLVQKEETGVAAWRHRLAPASPELEPAGDPPAAVMVTAYTAVVVVQPSAVAEDETSLGRLDQLSERRDPIAQRHPGGV